MQFFAVIFSGVHCLYECGIFKEVAVLNGFGDFRQILIDYSARAYIKMTDFAVAHLSVGKSDAESACAESGRRVVCYKTVYYFTAVDGYCVAFARGGKPVAVHYNQCVRCFFHLKLRYYLS